MSEKLEELDMTDLIVVVRRDVEHDAFLQPNTRLGLSPVSAGANIGTPSLRYAEDSGWLRQDPSLRADLRPGVFRSER